MGTFQTSTDVRYTAAFGGQDRTRYARLETYRFLTPGRLFVHDGAVVKHFAA
jgi:hypothetical protein